MNKYRLGYTFCFITHDPFTYKGYYISSMDVGVLFKVFNATGEEILFDSYELEEQSIYINERSYYLTDLITCCFDKNELVRIEPNLALLAEIKMIDNITFSWEIDRYYKSDFSSETIEKEEFFDIMRNNLDAFDNKDNRSAQCPSFFVEKINNEQAEQGVEMT